LEEPEVKYAVSGDVHVAYQLFGSGPLNLVSTPGTISHLDYFWRSPEMKAYLEALGSFARVVVFDKRGTGLSDRNAGVPTYEERMDDIRAVMDAAHFENAILLGHSEGVPMSILFAASYPSRTRGLVLYGGEAKGTWSQDYPWESTPQEWEAYFERVHTTWATREGAERAISHLAPSRLGDSEYIRWYREMMRMGGSPGAAIALGKSEMNMDVRSVLPTIHVPTLVIHLTGDRACNVEEGRFIAARIPGARLLELPGVDHLFWVDSRLRERIVQEIRDFATGSEPAVQSNRMLTTVLFTDIADSTKKAVELGDSRWRSLLAQHDSIARAEIKKLGGRELKSTGDGFLATFDGPTRAIKCAWTIVRGAKGLGLQVRGGVHTGECIFDSNDVSGIAIHIASRVMDEAKGGEILVSATVKDLVYGSGISFDDRGDHFLKGMEESRRLYSVAGIGQ
jgi:class 3 adenylate cyclase